MDSFYIISNASRDEGLEVTHMVEDFFRDHGKKFETHKSAKFRNDSYTDESAIPEDTDCVVVLGGDGTLIQAAHDTAGLDIPLLGINLGKMGFLTDIEKDNIIPSLEALLSGKFKIEERMMICGVVNAADGSRKDESRSLNDIVIHRTGNLRVVEYDIYVNDKFLSCFRADGIIISTPTGSTGYSLSAGGPIVEPMSQMFVITPICSHMFNARSIVLSANDIVKVVTSDGNVDVTFDGHKEVPLSEGESVTVRRSSKITKIVRMNDDSFLTVLHNKFTDR